MASSNTRAPRGPYRQRKRTPRQTLHSRRVKQLKSCSELPATTDCSAEPPAASLLVPPSPRPTAESSLIDSEQLSDSIDSCLIHSCDQLLEQMDNSQLSQSTESTAGQSYDPSSALDSPVIDTATEAHLYPGSSISLTDSQLLFRSFASRHHLSNQAKQDLLDLLHCHIPDVSVELPGSLFRFKNKFSASANFENIITEQLYCSKCFIPIPTVKQHLPCPNTLCGAPSSEFSIFLTLSIDKQLENLLKRN